MVHPSHSYYTERYFTPRSHLKKKKISLLLGDHLNLKRLSQLRSQTINENIRNKSKKSYYCETFIKTVQFLLGQSRFLKFCERNRSLVKKKVYFEISSGHTKSFLFHFIFDHLSGNTRGSNIPPLFFWWQMFPLT